MQVREPFSPQFPFSQRVRSMKSASFAMLKVDKACVWQTLQTLCEEDCLVADAVVLMLPGVLSLPGITLPSIELLPCWKKKHSHLPSFNVLPVLLIDRTSVQQWSSYRPPVLKKGLACRCQPVTLVSKPFSSEFPFSQRGGPMKSVSFAMLKAEKT